MAGIYNIYVYVDELCRAVSIELIKTMGGEKAIEPEAYAKLNIKATQTERLSQLVQRARLVIQSL